MNPLDILKKHIKFEVEFNALPQQAILAAMEEYKQQGAGEDPRVKYWKDIAFKQIDRQWDSAPVYSDEDKKEISELRENYMNKLLAEEPQASAGQQREVRLPSVHKAFDKFLEYWNDDNDLTSDEQFAKFYSWLQSQQPKAEICPYSLNGESDREAAKRVWGSQAPSAGVSKERLIVSASKLLAGKSLPDAFFDYLYDRMGYSRGYSANASADLLNFIKPLSSSEEQPKEDIRKIILDWLHTNGIFQRNLSELINWLEELREGEEQPTKK